MLQWVPAVRVPTVDKSVNPSNAGIGQTVTWTVTAVVPENLIELYDVPFVDTLPARPRPSRSYGTATCASGPLCPPCRRPTPLTATVLPTGETRVGWFVGDVARQWGRRQTTYTFTFTAQVASTYSGSGTPAAGTKLTDTDLVNRIQPWFTLDNALDRYDDALAPRPRRTQPGHAVRAPRRADDQVGARHHAEGDRRQDGHQPGRDLRLGHRRRERQGLDRVRR